MFTKRECDVNQFETSNQNFSEKKEFGVRDTLSSRQKERRVLGGGLSDGKNVFSGEKSTTLRERE